MTSATDRCLTAVPDGDIRLNLLPRRASVPSLRGAEPRGSAVLREVRVHAAPGRGRTVPGRPSDALGRGRLSPGVERPGRSASASSGPLPTSAAIPGPSGGAPDVCRPGGSRVGGSDPPSTERKILRSLSGDHLSRRGVLPRMSATPTVKRGGRRGRRTGTMVRIARERISDLFSLAEREALSGHPELADRYVGLARRVGMRYTVRLLAEYRELYCRTCSAFWVEGRTVRTRFRRGRRVRTCLRCGRPRRTLIKVSMPRTSANPWGSSIGARRDEGALAIGLPGEESESSEDESEEE